MQILDELRIMFAGICTDFESRLVEFDGEGDHVHLLVEYPPKVAISKLLIESSPLFILFGA